MFDDYDGIDYSRSNPPPNPSLKWDSDLGITAMQKVWRVAHDHIFDALDQQHERVVRLSEAFLNYIHLRPNTRGAKSFVDLVQRTIFHEVPLFSMTFGQMFEEAIANRGLHPYNSTRTQTFWTGNWMQPVEGPRPEVPYEGYGIVTRPHGWSVIYQEDRSKGLSTGMISSRIRTGRHAEKRPGVLVRTVSRYWGTDEHPLHVYPQNMGALPSPSSSRAAHRLDEYIHLYGNETYEGAIERVIHLANAVADFMNDRDFHMLEELKREIRRHDDARPVVMGEMFSSLEKQIPKALLGLIGDAAVLSEQLRLGKRAYDLFKVAFSGRWDAEGWREATDDYERNLGASLPETMDPDRVNVYYATKLGSYPVEEWEGMPVVDEDGEVTVPEYFE